MLSEFSVVEPPRTIDELLARARAARGATIAELAARVRFALPEDSVRAKGKLGEVLERTLGATGGSRAEHDFPDLGVELKSIPVDELGKPRESTFVCKIHLEDADEVEWEDSWTRRKLACVLFVPVVTPDDAPMQSRRIGEPVLFRPTDEQDGVLRADYEDAMGMIALGRVEELTAHSGRWLQVRPKARDGSARVVTFGPERERIEAMPRGFYLRTLFTDAIMRDPRAVP
jgi:DNA mismatch repair protein MutH